MTQIAVPVPRPAVPQTEQPKPYRGRHRLPGEETVVIRPRSLAEADGPTARLNVASGVVAAARAVWGLLR